MWSNSRPSEKLDASGFGPVGTIPALTARASELGRQLPCRLPDSLGSSRCFPCGGLQQGVFRNDSLTPCVYSCSILVDHCSQGQDTGGA